MQKKRKQFYKYYRLRHVLRPKNLERKQSNMLMPGTGELSVAYLFPSITSLCCVPTCHSLSPAHCTNQESVKSMPLIPLKDKPLPS